MELALRTKDLPPEVVGKAPTLILESAGLDAVGLDRAVVDSMTTEPDVCLDDETFRIRMSSGRKKSCQKLKKKHCN